MLNVALPVTLTRELWVSACNSYMGTKRANGVAALFGNRPHLRSIRTVCLSFATVLPDNWSVNRADDLRENNAKALVLMGVRA